MDSKEKRKINRELHMLYKQLKAGLITYQHYLARAGQLWEKRREGGKNAG